MHRPDLTNIDTGRFPMAMRMRRSGRRAVTSIQQRGGSPSAGSVCLSHEVVNGGPLARGLLWALGIEVVAGLCVYGMWRLLIALR